MITLGDKIIREIEIKRSYDYKYEQIILKIKREYRANKNSVSIGPYDWKTYKERLKKEFPNLTFKYKNPSMSGIYRIIFKEKKYLKDLTLL